MRSLQVGSWMNKETTASPRDCWPSTCPWPPLACWPYLYGLLWCPRILGWSLTAGTGVLGMLAPFCSTVSLRLLAGGDGVSAHDYFLDLSLGVGWMLERFKGTLRLSFAIRFSVAWEQARPKAAPSVLKQRTSLLMVQNCHELRVYNFLGAVYIVCGSVSEHPATVFSAECAWCVFATAFRTAGLERSEVPHGRSAGFMGLCFVM